MASLTQREFGYARLCHGLLDSSLGKLAYTLGSAVSLHTVYT